MSAILYLSREPEPLELDANRQIPDAWAKWDLVSQGLVSRYLARIAKPSKNDKTLDAELAPWVILHPFVASDPQIYGLWNADRALKENDLKSLLALGSECHVDAQAFSAAELKSIRSLWKTVQEWAL